MKRFMLFLLFLVFIMIFSMACGGTSSNSPEVKTYNPRIESENFISSTTIDNQYMPLIPGTIYTYEGETEEGVIERIIVEVTNQTKEIMGVTCVVVRDTVSEIEDEEAKIIEDTYDWFAQDNEGNVWYFGEDSKEYEEGEVVSTEGSWETGVDGALPGIIMYADPQIGVSYRQEYYFGEAEDMAEVLSLDETVTVFYGTFENCLLTKEWNPLEPGVEENKYYAPGIGLILEMDVEGGEDEAELISISNN